MTETNNEKRIFSRIGLILFGTIILTVLLQLAGSFLAARFWPGIQSGSWGYYALTLLPQYLIVMPLAAWALKSIPAAPITRVKLNLKQLWNMFMMSYSVMFVGNLVGILVSLIISFIAKANMSNFLAELIEGSDIWANLVMIALLAPIAEELFYRKLLIERLKKYGERTAVITSALVFGLVHGNISQFFYAFAVGLIFGYIFIITGRIIYTIVLHILINFFGSVVVSLIEDSLWAGLYGFAILAITIAGLVFLVKNKKSMTFQPGDQDLPREKWKSTVFLNLGMVLFFAACLALFVTNTYYALQ